MKHIIVYPGTGLTHSNIDFPRPSLTQTRVTIVADVNGGKPHM